MRLIDVDKITSGEIAKHLGRGYEFCAPDIEDMLREQPTAFDAEMVLGQLEECIESSMNGANNVECAYWNRGIERAIEIVKGGGVDAETES